MVKAKNDEGSSTDSCDEKDKMDDKLVPGCSHVNKSIESSKLRKAMKTSGINQKCCECEKIPDPDLCNDDMFEYDNTLWLCLRCGTQLCGRRKNKHALDHYNVSSLAELSFQRLGLNYVETITR
jgi:ubiquitin carboxyl-terminal hydrolase 16/45